MGTFEDRYNKLNPKQTEAVDHINGPLLVIAGPGTGKTEILGLRVANILRKVDTTPENILCLTFTNSASHNMRDRLTGLIGRDAYKVAIHTFHSFGVEIIAQNPEYFFNGTAFYPADDLTQFQILEEVFNELSYDNPLSVNHPEGGYVYLGSVRDAIGHLKKGGLGPDEFRSILEHNKKILRLMNPGINSVFAQRVSKGLIGVVEDFMENLQSIDIDDPPLPGFRSTMEVVRSSLKNVLDDVMRSAKTSPLTVWKSGMTKRDDSGNVVLRDSLYEDKLFALAEIYKEYQLRMYALRYYDFDDMILQAIEGIEKNDTLRYELRDRCEYILVDEFQDTNDAQMRLLRLITARDEKDIEPNVMAVGDDDQAIYKFQGAELSNVLNFKKTYPKTKIVAITSNYRSTQDILDLARYIITKGELRLENLVSDLDKHVIASNEAVLPGVVTSKSFPTNLHEYCWISNEIKRLVGDGKQPGDIAVIARQHSHLEDIALILNHMGIPLAYERHNNVLSQPHVRQLITISRFIDSICRKNRDAADELLPEILSYPFWTLDRKVIWDISKIAESSQRKRLRWLDVMQSYGDDNVRRIAGFLLELGADSSHETLEHVIDTVMGAHEILAPESEEDEEEDTQGVGNEKYVSPFKEYYFSEDKLRENSVEYLRFLSGLRTFIQALRNYRKGKVLKIGDLVEFADMHEKNNIPVIDNSYFVNAGDSVNLLTAHKAKGLEFDTVFVINCLDDIWTGRGRGSILPFPVNLPITPAGDTLDDQLRLFYVAVTRAKSNLYLTSYETSENGNDTSRLQFLLSPTEDEKVEAGLRRALTLEEKSFDLPDVPGSLDVLNVSWESCHTPPVVHDEKAVLEALLDRYHLSVTHLNNFLNVASGGPLLFFQQNLLRFPQSKSLPGSYGSAIHRTMESIYKYLKQNGDHPSIDTVLGWYEEELLSERLSDRDFGKYLKRGRDTLGIFYKNKMDAFHASHFSEVNFREQGVVIADAHLTGKIDKMVPLGGGEVSVHDFKTGKPKADWKGGGRHEKIQLHQYRRQLVFYKILVENSRDFSGKYKVRRGVLEFVEPLKGELFELTADIDQDELDRTAELANVVYNKIRNLDFPDVSAYRKDLKGILDFEEDLLTGKFD